MSKLGSQPAVGFYDENCGGKAMFPHFSVIKFNWIGIHFFHVLVFSLIGCLLLLQGSCTWESLAHRLKDIVEFKVDGLVRKAWRWLYQIVQASVSEILSSSRFPCHFLKGFMGTAGCGLPFIMYKSNKANGVALAKFKLMIIRLFLNLWRVCFWKRKKRL